MVAWPQGRRDGSWNPTSVASVGGLVLVLAALLIEPVAYGRAAEPDPATPAALRVLRVLDRIERRLQRTGYQHRTVVRERRGVYYWDCSGMVAWVLERVAPHARRGLFAQRPVAEFFYDTIVNAREQRPWRGWTHVRDLRRARPGDVFAWKRPEGWPPRNTGHVGFLLEVPKPAPGRERAYAVRIADATSIPHQNDTRSATGEGGYGKGTMLFTLDAEGRPTAYGWRGVHSRRVVETDIAIGRVHY